MKINKIIMGLLILLIIPFATAHILGDGNGNGILDDCETCLTMPYGTPACLMFDTDGNTIIEAMDVMDCNLNKKSDVDLFDICFGKAIWINPECDVYDFDGNDIIEGPDRSVFMTLFSQGIIADNFTDAEDKISEAEALRIDWDNDGYNGTLDCNDYNISINPNATEVCGNGIDEDCSGADLACPVVDNGGGSSGGGGGHHDECEYDKSIYIKQGDSCSECYDEGESVWNYGRRCWCQTEQWNCGRSSATSSTATKCVPKIECEEFGECINGTQTSICRDSSHCGNVENKEKACDIPEVIVEEPKKDYTIEFIIGSIIVILICGIVLLLTRKKEKLNGGSKKNGK